MAPLVKITVNYSYNDVDMLTPYVNYSYNYQTYSCLGAHLVDGWCFYFLASSSSWLPTGDSDAGALEAPRFKGSLRISQRQRSPRLDVNI